MPDTLGQPDARRRAPSLLIVGALLVILAIVGATFVLTRTERFTGAVATGPVERARAGASDPGILDPSDIVEVVPPDGIPAIDEPKFLTTQQASWLSAREPVIAVEVDGEARAYPLQIMTWHEIVNDTIRGTPIAVTFCPLCNTALAFERPRIDGEVTTFGTSGKLINSNLLMYDRATESLWPQVTGVALTGPQRGRELERIPAQIVAWADFQGAHPNGIVLSRDTGHDRRYGDNPYPGYDDVDKAPFLYSGEVDGRLAAVERVLGVTAGRHVVAFPYFRLEEIAQGDVSVAQAQVGGTPVVVFWKKGTVSALDAGEIVASRDVGAAAAFSRDIGGRDLDFIMHDDTILDRQTRTRWDIFGRAVEGRLAGRRLASVAATDSFWFDWAAFHPETQLWRP